MKMYVGCLTELSIEELSSWSAVIEEDGNTSLDVFLNVYERCLLDLRLLHNTELLPAGLSLRLVNSP